MPEEKQNQRLEKKDKYLPCKLTDEQIMTKAKEAAEIMVQVAEDQGNLEMRTEAFNGFKKAIKEDIESNIRKASAISKTVDSGEERQDVACEVLFDYDEGKVTVTRLDTKEVIETRDMTDEELQELPIDGIDSEDGEDLDTDAEGAEVPFPTDGDDQPYEDYEEDNALGD
jgi:hypothetical protein